MNSKDTNVFLSLPQGAGKTILTNAYFSTTTAGFETALEATSENVDVEDYAFLKESIAEYSKRVKMGLALFVA